MNTVSGRLTRLVALDGVRGVAALMVMVFHYWQAGGLQRLGIPSKVAQIAVFGQTGVDLFFVLSGFLITRILISTRRQPRYFHNFYGRRALRILPLYYLFLVIFYFVLPLLDGSSVESFRKTWWYWVYLQNVPDTFTGLVAAGPLHYWSLAVEEHFYIFWPLVVYYAPVQLLTRLSLALIGVAAICRGILIYGLGVGVFYFTFCRMDALAIGAFLACLEAAGRLDSCRKVWVAVLAVLLPVLVILWTHLSGSRAEALQLVKFSMIALVYAALLGLVISGENSVWAGRVFGNRPLRFAGQISYGLYIYHGTCFYLVSKSDFVDGVPILHFLLSFTAAFLVSWLSFRLIERPFLSLKSLFAYHAEEPGKSASLPIPG